MNDKMYRYQETRYSIGVDENGDVSGDWTLKVELLEYHIVKTTPKGVWISLHLDSNKKFVKLGCLRQYAHKTKNEALKSFVARKRKQILILENQLSQAKSAKLIAEAIEI